MEQMQCRCGRRVEAGASFCPYCGQRLGVAPEVSAPQAGSGAELPQPVAAPVPPTPEQGQSQVRPERRCSACQAVWEKEFKFCPDCGAPASGRLAQLKLVVRCSGGTQQEVLLDGSTVVLGSGPEATLQVSDPYVSRKHCQFTPMADGDYQVEDLSSANGTFVRTSGPTPVTPGSEFLVGSSLISVRNA